MAPQKLNKDEFRLLRDFIEENCGIALGDQKEYLIENRLHKLLQDSGCKTYKEFYLKAKKESRSGLRDKIVDAMTTNETSWFRDNYPYEILKKTLFPQYHKEALEGKRRGVRIWSAACSTGQEPYSMSMTLLDFAKSHTDLLLKNSEIVATDISPSTVYMATAGTYDDFAVDRGLPSAHKNTYFEKKGRFWSIKDEVRNCTAFKIFNLQDGFTAFGKFDVVFCRNVAIYFSAQSKKILFSKIVNALNPGGYLFLGGSESISGFSNRFEMIKYNSGVYYRIKDNP